MFEVVPGEPAHAAALAPRMRADDALEVWTLMRYSPAEALARSMAASRDTKAAILDGRVLCMFGVAQQTVLSDWGCPWLLTADEMPRHRKLFLRESRRYFDDMADRHALLVNFVDARYTAAVRWARWLGFTVDPAAPMGPDNVPFHRISKVR